MKRRTAPISSFSRPNVQMQNQETSVTKVGLKTDKINQTKE